MKSVCGVVVKVRDEQDTIENSLLSLYNQTIKPFIVVVNDGSADKTGEIASKYADVVVNLPRHDESWVGRPELARVVNTGLDVLKRRKFDYMMFSDGEAVYPSHYIEELTKKMSGGEIVLASGVAEGEASRSSSPRGCGRVADVTWFRTVGFKYPENYGFEVYLVYKALSQGKKVVVFPELEFKLERKTRLFPKKAYFWGKGMKALNYNFFYALGRAFLVLLRSPKNGMALLRGYFSDVQKYSDIASFVASYQRRQMWRRLHEVFNPWSSSYFALLQQAA